MRTNIEIDDEVMSEAMSVLGTTTKRDTVDQALRQAIRLKRQKGLMRLWGLGWEGDLDEMRTDKPRPEYG